MNNAARRHRKLDLEELRRIVSLGEGVRTEFKRKVPRPERLAKEVIAFANTRGGQILLGVDDDGTVRGVRDHNEEMYSLSQAVELHCKPQVTLRIDRIALTKRRDVLVVTVPDSPDKPHFLVAGKKNRRERIAYVRVRDMSVEASKEAVRLMTAESNNEVVHFEFGDQELMLMRYLETYGRITVEQFASVAAINSAKASNTLIQLTRADVLRIHSDPRGDYFTVS